MAAFKTTEETSIQYSKLDSNALQSDIQLEAAMGHELMKALKKGADYVSVRFVP